MKEVTLLKSLKKIHWTFNIKSSSHSTSEKQQCIARIYAKILLIKDWHVLCVGSFINHVDIWGGGGKPNDQFITEALLCKSDHEGGGGLKYPEFWPRCLSMTPMYLI